jgi:hypothetical protein
MGAFSFREEIENVINCCSKENDSNTPDFILSNYLCNCLDAFTLATKNRDKWYSVHLEPCNSHFLNPPKSEEIESPDSAEEARPVGETNTHMVQLLCDVQKWFSHRESCPYKETIEIGQRLDAFWAQQNHV